MKRFIYVLLLFIWTITCLNTNQSDESPTKGDELPDSRDSKLDNFRKRLLSFVVGIMIIAFTFTCFCLLHYNCMIDEIPTTKKPLNKENMEAVSSWVSKVSAYQHEIPNECTLENQPLLLNTEQLHEPSSPEKSPIPLSLEKSIQPPDLENPATPSNAEKLMESSIPENSSMPCSSKELIRQPSPKMSSNSSSPAKLNTSYHLEKSYRKHKLKKPQKLTHEPVGQVRSSYSVKPVMPPWLAILQSSATLTIPSCPTLPQKQILSAKPSSLKKPGKSQGYHVKKSVSIGKTIVLSTPRPAKICRHYKERCLVCNSSSELLIDNISDAKKENIGNLPVSSNVKSISMSFYEAESKNNVYTDNDDMKAGDSGDSDEEIIIICDMNCNDIIPKGTSDN